MESMGSISKPMAWLCLLLILGSAVAFVAHHHSDGTESATCTVCVAAHSASPALPTLSLVAIFLAVSTIQTAAATASRQRLIAFALSVRPPPEV
jgi:hypothetical protein